VGKPRKRELGRSFFLTNDWGRSSLAGSFSKTLGRLCFAFLSGVAAQNRHVQPVAWATLQALFLLGQKVLPTTTASGCVCRR
jgi:hypothetical protein